MPIAGPLPDALRDYHLLRLGVSLRDILDAPALLLDDLLDIDAIYREVEADARRAMDAQRDRRGSASPGVAGEGDG